MKRLRDLVVIFRTHSDIEAQIVRGLLETHGVMSVLASDVPHSIFPLSVDGLGEVRISVMPGDADEAQRIIESHRTEVRVHLNRAEVAAGTTTFTGTTVSFFGTLNGTAAGKAVSIAGGAIKVKDEIEVVFEIVPGR